MPASGLECRLIALLSLDYKILARILATRLSKHMESLVHATQNGFVPGRSIYDTIDIFTAAKRLVELDLTPAPAVVLMLVFQTAYDSVGRVFLARALR